MSVGRTNIYSLWSTKELNVCFQVTPDTPLTVLRQPRRGEMVVSMSGSPVMVPSCYTWVYYLHAFKFSLIWPTWNAKCIWLDPHSVIITYYLISLQFETRRNGELQHITPRWHNVVPPAQTIASVTSVHTLLTDGL